MGTRVSNETRIPSSILGIHDQKLFGLSNQMLFYYLEDKIMEEEDMSWVGTSTVEEYDGTNPCLLCGEGPYREPEYHLFPICGCGQSWYHPACSTQLVKSAFGVCWIEPLICPHFPGCFSSEAGKTVEQENQEEDVGSTEEQEEEQKEEEQEDVELQQAIMKILMLAMLKETKETS
jgi:hypothetical protein